MGTQNAIINETALKENAYKICWNLSPLVGCLPSEKRWCPRVGYNTCSELSMFGLYCSNALETSVEADGEIYSYEPKITPLCSEIWKQALECSDKVLSTTYLSSVKEGINPNYTISQRLLKAAKIGGYTDSTIFDGVWENINVASLDIYRQILLILLSAYALRYSLYEYSKEHVAFDKNAINTAEVERLINNINYVKYVLSITPNFNIHFYKSYEFIRQQLTTLQKNLYMLKSHVLRYVE